MAYIIHGPIPTQAVGKCGWCDKENEVLHLLAVKIEGTLCAEYVCAKCILLLDEMRKETAKKKGKLIISNNPAVEVDEDEVN